jgi:hypothetical protein
MLSLKNTTTAGNNSHLSMDILMSAKDYARVTSDTNHTGSWQVHTTHTHYILTIQGFLSTQHITKHRIPAAHPSIGHARARPRPDQALALRVLRLAELDLDGEHALAVMCIPVVGEDAFGPGHAESVCAPRRWRAESTVRRGSARFDRDGGRGEREGA